MFSLFSEGNQDKEKVKEKLMRLDTQKDLFDQMTSVFTDASPLTPQLPKAELISDVAEPKPLISVSCKEKVAYTVFVLYTKLKCIIQDNKP